MSNVADEPKPLSMAIYRKFRWQALVVGLGLLVAGFLLGWIVAPEPRSVALVNSPLVTNVRQNYPDQAADWLETHHIAIDITVDARTPDTLIVEPWNWPTHFGMYQFSSSATLKIVHNPSSAPVPETFRFYLVDSYGLYRIIRVQGHDLLKVKRIVIDSHTITFEPPIEPINQLDLRGFWNVR